jgi:hypothetical protein
MKSEDSNKQIDESLGRELTAIRRCVEELRMRFIGTNIPSDIRGIERSVDELLRRTEKKTGRWAKAWKWFGSESFVNTCFGLIALLGALLMGLLLIRACWCILAGKS